MSRPGNTQVEQVLEEATKTVEVPVPLKLRDDTSPELKADMNANGHSLLNVDDIQCKTVNGQEWRHWAKDLAKWLQEWALKTFAMFDHMHPEIDDLRKWSQENFSSTWTNAEARFCPKKHTHTVESLTGAVSLSKLERGEEVKALLEARFAPADHTHGSLESAVTATQQRQDELAKAQEALTPRSETDALLREVARLQGELEKSAQELRKDLEALHTPEPLEVMAIRFCLVPQKCDGKRLRSFVAYDFNGQKVDAMIKRQKNQKPLALGEVVAAGELLLSPPNAIVCYTFA